MWMERKELSDVSNGSYLEMIIYKFEHFRIAMVSKTTKNEAYALSILEELHVFYFAETASIFSGFHCVVFIALVTYVTHKQ